MARAYRLFKSPTGELVRVDAGFSWHAFWVGSATALVKRAWLPVVLLAAAYGVAVFMNEAPRWTSRNEALAIALLCLYVLYMLFCGVFANRWLVESLRRRGYVQVRDEKK